MIFVACAVTVLCLVAVSHSAPLPCEELVQPLDQLDLQLLKGRWALVAGSLSNPSKLEMFKQRESASVNFASNTSETQISYTRALRVENQCKYYSYNISWDGSNFTYEGTDRSNFTASFVHTSCRDCILLHLKFMSGKMQNFYVFSQRRQLEPEEMEEFKAQVECLNMPPPVMMDPTKELCPEETADDLAAVAPTEETTNGQSN